MGIAIEGIGSDILVLSGMNLDYLNAEPDVYVLEAAFSLMSDSEKDMIRDRVVFVTVVGGNTFYGVKFYTETVSISVEVEFSKDGSYYDLWHVYLASRIPIGLGEVVTYDYGMPYSLRDYVDSRNWFFNVKNDSELIHPYPYYFFMSLLNEFKYSIPLRDIVHFDVEFGTDGNYSYATLTDSDGKFIDLEYVNNYPLHVFTDVIYN